MSAKIHIGRMVVSRYTYLKVITIIIIYENNFQKENNLTNINSPQNNFVETTNTGVVKNLLKLMRPILPVKYIQSSFDNITRWLIVDHFSLLRLPDNIYNLKFIDFK